MPSSKAKKKEPSLWKALSNSIRRDLLTFIGDKEQYTGSVSFTQIQQEFNMKVGTLYHHLDTLGALITQDDKKRYLLTEKGRKAYILIEDEIDNIAKEIPSSGFISFIHKFFLNDLFTLIRKDSLRFLGITLFILSGLLVGSYFLSYSPVLIYPFYLNPQYLAPISFIFSVVVLYILTDFLCSIIFKKSENKFALFQSVIIVEFPLFIFGMIESFTSNYSYPVSPFELDWWLFAILVLVQILFVGLMIEALIVIKELRMEKAGFIALLIVYTLSGLSLALLKGLVVIL